MYKVFSIALFGVATVVVAQDRKAPIQPVPKGLEGGFTIVSGERDGKVIPPERISGSVVKFTADTILGTDKDKKEFFASKYTLDTSKTPWVINMKSTSPKDGEATGLIKRDGDTITIVYNLPGGAVPTEFRTKEKQHLFVLKNLNKEPKKGGEPDVLLKKE